MKFLPNLLIALFVVFNLFFVQSVLADEPEYTDNPDYIQVTETLDRLSLVADTEKETQETVSEEIQQQIDQLQFQKYALESGINWGQCRNETGRTLAVYGSQPQEDDDDEMTTSLYFLADGQTTKPNWDCDGVYFPKDLTATNLGINGQAETLQGPVAIKIMDGTQLVLKTNPDTEAVEFNAPLSKVVEEKEVNWYIPNVSQAIIDSRLPNAPTQKS